MVRSEAPPSVVNLVLFAIPILSAALFRLLSAPFRWHNWNGAPVLYKDVFFTAIRTMLTRITIAQTRFIHGTTTATYLGFCKMVKQEPESVEIEQNKTVAHWIGRSDAKVVVLYLHGERLHFNPVTLNFTHVEMIGGGYTNPCTPEHMSYFHRLVTDINGSSKEGKPAIAVLLLAYTLAPEAAFPAQLKQASTILSYLLTNAKRSPSNIMIAGDSAGGGLALSLLSHLLHPHPEIPKVTISSPFRGVFLYSPWVSFDTTHDSFTRNSQKDCLVPNMLRKWAGMYLGTVSEEIDPGVVSEENRNNYSEPLLANPSWWERAPKVVEKAWIFGGENEVFVDSIRKFGRKFSEGWKTGGGKEEGVELVLAQGDAHIAPMMDFMLQYKEKSVSQLGLERWLKERLVR